MNRWVLAVWQVASLLASLYYILCLCSFLHLFSRKKQRQHDCRRHFQTEEDHQKLTTLHVFFNRVHVFTEHTLKTPGQFSSYLSPLNTNRSRFSSAVRLQEPKSHYAMPYYMEKDNCLSVKTLSKKASPSVSRNLTTADLCSVKVLMEDITTGCFLILLCLIAHTFCS